ncbi:MAG: hypothetical protein GXY49_04585 [Syntrophomonadaceae bacterium]|nr:hypothetical protein [Syntrophomonadaceae bacterium]
MIFLLEGILPKALGDSNGGQSFLALYSTYKDKSGVMHSRIVPTLTPGPVVTTTRNDVQYVVTEYGVAWLKGFNLTSICMILSAYFSRLFN